MALCLVCGWAVDTPGALLHPVCLADLTEDAAVHHYRTAGRPRTARLGERVDGAPAYARCGGCLACEQPVVGRVLYGGGPAGTGWVWACEELLAIVERDERRRCCEAPVPGR